MSGAIILGYDNSQFPGHEAVVLPTAFNCSHSIVADGLPNKSGVFFFHGCNVCYLSKNQNEKGG